MHSQIPTHFRAIYPNSCPFPGCLSQVQSPDTGRPVRFGFFFRKEDSRLIQRFRCRHCRRCFSRATFSPCFRQKKRRVNRKIEALLGSTVTLRRAAQVAGVNRKTVVRKFLFLGKQAELENSKISEQSLLSPESEIQFDELETFEHTKLKPLSVPLAVEAKTRRILSIQVARMPAKGLLAEKSRRKYGLRADERPKALRDLLKEVSKLSPSPKLLRSDSNPHYPSHVRRQFPAAQYVREMGRQAHDYGHGELKRGAHDPLFWLNHTCAMLRANLSRLVRKTWSTTKKPERLALHLAIYMSLHNQKIAQAIA